MDQVVRDNAADGNATIDRGVRKRGAMTRKRHSPEEIAAKLHQADEMMERGRRQVEIARALGVSIMTYHRWRKARPAIVKGAEPAQSRPAPIHDLVRTEEIVRIDELRIENERLRRLVTDLLLEKIRLEEALQIQPTVGSPEKKSSG